MAFDVIETEMVWRSAPFPGALHVPAMLSRDEVDYLYWLASTWRRGTGRVVELGCFLGGSTFALASGLAHHPAGSWDPSRMLVYDSFEMTADAARDFSTPYLAGDSFRPLFDAYLQPYTDRLMVRDMWLPLDCPPERATDVYSEQDAIEVLFIDCAKKWGVHNTALTVFGPHLISGAMLVEQDFKVGAYWIALHLYQLRQCFRPVHDVPGCTVAFEYQGGIEEYLPRLYREDAFPDDDRVRIWDEVEAYYTDAFGRGPASAHARFGVALGRARHMIYGGHHIEGVAALERAARDVWDVVRSDAPIAWRVEFCQQWSVAIEKLLRVLARRDGATDLVDRVRLLGDEQQAGEGTEQGNASDHHQTWERVAQSLRRSGISRIALYPAGRHTRELLSGGWPGDDLAVVALLDDHNHGDVFNGIPVLPPAGIPDGVQAVVLSSREHEAALASQILESLPSGTQATSPECVTIAGSRPAVIRVYTARLDAA